MKENTKGTFVFFSISDRLGGAEQVLYQIVYYFANLGYNVNVVFYKPKLEHKWNNSFKTFKNVTIYYSNSNIIKFLKVFFVFENVNYIFSTHLMINALLGLSRYLTLIKTDYLVIRESTSVFGRYSNWKLMKYKLAYYFGYKSIDLIICQSIMMKQKLIENVAYLPKRSKIVYISNPFNLKKNKSDFIFNEPFIVSAGRLIPEKGFDVLIRSFKILKSDFPNLKLIILGEGKLRNNLENLIKDLDLEGEVILKGHVRNVYNYFKNAEVCIVSSRIEGFPNVLLQMMSQNINIVSTLCAGGIKEMNGIITTTPDNPEGLADAIKFCLENNLSQNREIFDRELSGRSIDQFVNKINYYLEIGK